MYGSSRNCKSGVWLLWWICHWFVKICFFLKGREDMLLQGTVTLELMIWNFYPWFVPFILIMPPSWGGILVLGCLCIRSWHFLMHARVLKFRIWILHGKIADTLFFLFELSPFLELCPFEKIRMKPFQQDISKHIWTGAWNLLSW